MSPYKNVYTSGIELKRVSMELVTKSDGGFWASIRANGYAWHGHGATPGDALKAMKGDINGTQRNSAKKPTNRYRTALSLGFGD